MRRLVAAPDKLRGTATAREAADAIALAARDVGIAATALPMSDGGEGFLEVLAADTRRATVSGPLGEPVDAQWALVDDGTALIESAQAAGRALLTQPSGDQPLRASTAGVGELIAVALSAGATSIVVGCGGTSTSDGGLGCIEALDGLGVEVTVPLVVAYDVDTRFTDAAARFGPQKGASPDQVAALEARLFELAAAYRRRFGVDVTRVPGSGAAGGLAGALIALGASARSGARYVSDRVGLEAALVDADLVVTAEGAIDEGTLSGKVVDVVLAARPVVPALVVAGVVDAGAVEQLRARRSGAVDVLALSPERQARLGTSGSIREAVRDYLSP